MMIERFDRGVAPFQELQTLFILGGTNSLRGGVPAADVIRDLKEIRQKCRARGITPVPMTLPPSIRTISGARFTRILMMAGEKAPMR